MNVEPAYVQYITIAQGCQKLLAWIFGLKTGKTVDVRTAIFMLPLLANVDIVRLGIA